MTKTRAFVRDPELDERVRSALVAASLQDIGYAYVLDLDSMHAGAYRAGSTIYPASVIKVAVMAEAYHQYAAGLVTPDQPVVVSSANQTTTAEFTPLVPGYTATVQLL